MLVLMSESESATVHWAGTPPQAHSVVRDYCRAPPDLSKVCDTFPHKIVVNKQQFTQRRET